MRALFLGDAVVVGAVVVPGAVAVLLAARLALLGLEVAVLAVGVARQLAHRVRGLARPLRVTLALLHTQLGLADVASLVTVGTVHLLQCCSAAVLTSQSSSTQHSGLLQTSWSLQTLQLSSVTKGQLASTQHSGS